MILIQKNFHCIVSGSIKEVVNVADEEVEGFVVRGFILQEWVKIILK